MCVVYMCMQWVGQWGWDEGLRWREGERSEAKNAEQSDDE